MISRARRSLQGAARAAGFLCAILLAGVAPLRAEEFFPTRDENPLVRGFYLPLPGAARCAAAASVTAVLSESNTLNAERRGGDSLLVDGESTTLRVSFDEAAGTRWRYRFTVPVVHDSGGILDPLINDWHEAFGLPQGDRPLFPNNKLLYLVTGVARIDLSHAETSLGNVSAETGWCAVDEPARTLSVWAGVAAPTGSTLKLTGDGAWDAALWTHAATRGPRWQLAGEFGIAQPFGDEIFAGHAHRSRAFGRFAATRRLSDAWSLRAQLDGETARVLDSQLRFLGPSLQLTAGATRRLANRWRLEFGLAEDVAVNTAPDVTFFIGVHD